jgi:hypothetical protein
MTWRQKIIPRFSLRTLLLAVLLIASAATLWWNWGPWTHAFTLRKPGIVSEFQFSEDDQRLYVQYIAPGAASDRLGHRLLDIHRAADGERLAQLAPPSTPGCFHIRGDYAVAVRLDPQQQTTATTTLLYDLRKGAMLPASKNFEGNDNVSNLTPHYVELWSGREWIVARLPDGKEVLKERDLYIGGTSFCGDKYACSRNHDFQIHDLSSGALLCSIPLDTDQNFAAPILCRKFLLVWTAFPSFTKRAVSVTRLLYFFDATTGKLDRMVDIGAKGPRPSHDGSRVLVSDRTKNMVEVYGIESNRPLAVISGAGSAEFSDDDALLLFTDNCRMYDGRTLDELWHMDNFSANLAPRGDYVVAANADTAFILDARTGRRLMQLPRYRAHGMGSDAVSRLAFAHGAPHLALNCCDTPTHIEVFKLRRPVAWCGPACLPEFWLTALLAVVLIWSLFRDRKTLRPKSLNPHGP